MWRLVAFALEVYIYVPLYVYVHVCVCVYLHRAPWFLLQFFTLPEFADLMACFPVPARTAHAAVDEPPAGGTDTTPLSLSLCCSTAAAAVSTDSSVGASVRAGARCWTAVLAVSSNLKCAVRHRRHRWTCTWVQRCHYDNPRREREPSKRGPTPLSLTSSAPSATPVALWLHFEAVHALCSTHLTEWRQEVVGGHFRGHVHVQRLCPRHGGPVCMSMSMSPIDIHVHVDVHGRRLTAPEHSIVAWPGSHWWRKNGCGQAGNFCCLRKWSGTIFVKVSKGAVAFHLCTVVQYRVHARVHLQGKVPPCGGRVAVGVAVSVWSLHAHTAAHVRHGKRNTYTQTHSRTHTPTHSH